MQYSIALNVFAESMIAVCPIYVMSYHISTISIVPATQEPYYNVNINSKFQECSVLYRCLHLILPFIIHTEPSEQRL